MENYKEYLADQILSEGKIVTYRALSRALTVHVDVAKQMLFECHHSQRSRQTGSIHATYMVYGVKKTAEAANGHSQPGDEAEMSGSMPEADSPADEIPLFTLSLVAEEQLKDVLAQHETVTSVHVYSLGPHPVKDLQLLAEVSKPILDAQENANSADPPKLLGAIRNPYARRRGRRGPTAKSMAQATNTRSDSKPASAKPAATLTVRGERKATQAATSSSVAKRPAPAPKRGGSGGIMQSFAKAASKPKKAPKSQPATPDSGRDSSNQVLSDDGEDDSEVMPEPKEDDTAAETARKARQEELRRMMEEDDDEREPEGKADTPMEESEEETPAPEADKPRAEEPAEVISSTGNGRRRGRRRVMKKETVMDDNGYLVVVQKPEWESFSEDEEAPPPKKTATAAQHVKPKKTAPKGQGNIMSFFAKK